MSVLTINNIYDQIKEHFNNVKLDENDYNLLVFIAKEPKDANKFLEMKIYVSRKDILSNGYSGSFEWGYFTNSENLSKGSIKFRTNENRISSLLNDIIKENRFDDDYIKIINNRFDSYSKMNESVEEVIEEQIVDITDICDLNEEKKYMSVSKEKIKYFLISLGLDIDVSDIYSQIFKPNGEVFGGSILDREPKIGDYTELKLNSISSKDSGGEIAPSLWIKLEHEFNKLPHVESVSISTYKYSLLVTFEDDIIVEIV